MTGTALLFCVAKAETPLSPIPQQQPTIAMPPALKDGEAQNPSFYTYAQIHHEYASGNLTQAKQMAMAHLIQYPKDVDVQYILGAIYYKEKNFTQAETILTRGLAESPKYDDIRILLIRTNLAQGDYAAALKLANDGLALEPNNQSFMDLKEKSLSATAEKNQPEKTLAAIPGTSTAKTSTVPPALPAVTYEDIRSEFDAGNLAHAKSMAENYLKKYPKDLDARYLLARIYIQEQNLPAAEEQLKTILAADPNYTDARVTLINQQINMNDYVGALNTVNAGLQHDPNNETFLFEKAVVYYMEGDYHDAKEILKNILAKDPDNTKAQGLYDAITNTPPLYGRGKSTIGFLQNLSHDSITGEMWDYSSLYYGYNSDYGYIQANANYADRLGQGDPQAYIEAYPIINKNLYLDLKAGYANNPTLFPDYLFGGEAYVLLPANVSVSLGDTYSNVNSGATYFNSYTGSLSKFFGKNGEYWLSFRPYHFIPNSGPESTLYTGSIRRYFGSPDFFLNLTIGGGHSPDLTDLQTVDFIKVKDNLYNASLQFPIAEHALVALVGINYETLEYPSGALRELLGGTLGLSYRFE